MAAEVNDDRESLRQITVGLGATPSRAGAAAARAAEWLGRFKSNGRLVGWSPLTDLIELEASRTAVAGKRVGWDFLRALADHDGRLDPRSLDRLLEPADNQLERLRGIHLRVALERDRVRRVQ